MLNVIFEDLTERQQAYREACGEYWIEIGDASTSSGEDSALYFVTVDDEQGTIGPDKDVERFCLITFGTGSSGDVIHYAYADFETLSSARAKALENIGDEIFSEVPVAVIDLDTGAHYEAKLDVYWELAQAPVKELPR